jgi:hypothetical protein
MSTDANQIELLVREVLARMAQQTKSEPGKAIIAMPPALPDDVLELMGNVISVQTLEGKLKGIKTVRIRQQAVITPAARDVLRAAKVTLVRGANAKGANANSAANGNSAAQPKGATSDSGAVKERPAALALLAPEKLVEIFKKQLCPRRASVALVDKEVEQIVNRLRTALSNGHRLGVVVAENSFELNMAVNRQGLRGVRIASWSDFQFALQEASPDVWVLDSRQLNIPAITNVCNRIYENGYWRSRKENR